MRIKNISDNDYILMDSILLILLNESNIDINKLQYHLLRCGIFCDQPLLRKALEKLSEDKLITKPKNEGANIN